MKKLVIMQPYLFPYIGYFQLVNVADTFVFYDDVDFITRGWINRNTLIQNDSKTMFTVPLKKASQNRKINDINFDLSEKWLKKFFKMLHHAYSKHPFYERTLSIIKKAFHETKGSISNLAAKSVQLVASELGLKTSFLFSSELNVSQDLDKEDRLIEICNILGYNHYVNAVGGMEIYTKKSFRQKGVELSFLKPTLLPYPQIKTSEFVPKLSIIDVLMNVKRDHVKDRILSEFELI